ncbi:hypothetical protein PQR53_00150 [Paraburkholderia fungorum]|uniref:hypothetical protein n=1 Tax=Paraburkholderia fungorum TaxID=134537 RepID=UPI0038BBC7D5
MFLRASLPEHHLSDDSTAIVKLGAGLMATLAALVPGLLIASAKISFDRLDEEFTQTAATVVMLDRTLADCSSAWTLKRSTSRTLRYPSIVFNSRPEDTADAAARWFKSE